MPLMPGWLVVALALLAGTTLAQSQQSQHGTATAGHIMADIPDNPDAPGREGYPQIFEAIENRDHDRVARLIASGADLEARGFGQSTPILKAALTHNWTMVEMLLAAGADPMVPDEFGITLPAVAARSRLKPDSKEGKALARVRAGLADRGLITLVFPPDQVRRMVAEGRWPPAPDAPGAPGTDGGDRRHD